MLLPATLISVITALKTDIIPNYTRNFIFFVTQNTNRVNQKALSYNVLSLWDIIGICSEEHTTYKGSYKRNINFLLPHLVVHRVATGFRWLRSFQNYPDLFLPGFNQSRIYRQILLQIPKSTFHENPAGESHADPSGNIDGQTDLHGKDNNRYCLCERPRRLFGSVSKNLRCGLRKISHIYIYIYICLRLYVWVCVYKHLHTYTHNTVEPNLHIFIHTHLHTHTHTRELVLISYYTYKKTHRNFVGTT